MGKSCKEIAQTLVECMKETKCVKDGGGIRDCLNETGKNGGGECQEFRNAYFICKRSALDMRTRIQGQKSY